jgi:hypothetical protein
MGVHGEYEGYQWDVALVLRQKYQEEIFRRRLGELVWNWKPLLSWLR